MASNAGLEFLSKLAEWRGTADFSLEPIQAVMHELGNPQESLKIVHIAGTNGKGSVSAMISSILGASGYSVGLLTSPHLANVNERIIVDGLPISDELLAENALVVKSAIEKAGVKLSFFEGITAIGLLNFYNLGLEWAVLEVGLGGRLDATNIVKRPKVAVIVSVELDHQHILGATKAEIAIEKAGIIKPEVPVVVGDMEQEALNQVEIICRAKNSALYAYNREFYLNYEQNKTQYHFGDTKIDQLKTSLNGSHQLHNAAVACTAAILCEVDRSSIEEGLKNVFWPARLEEVNTEKSRIYFDCAHNPSAVLKVIKFLDSMQIDKVDIAFGALDTKQWGEMLKLLEPKASSWHFLRPESSRAIDPINLKNAVSGSEVNTNVWEDYEQFIDFISKRNSDIPLIILGSIYMVGILRDKIVKEVKPIWRKL